MFHKRISRKVAYRLLANPPLNNGRRPVPPRRGSRRALRIGEACAARARRDHGELRQAVAVGSLGGSRDPHGQPESRGSRNARPAPRCIWTPLDLRAPEGRGGSGLFACSVCNQGSTSVGKALAQLPAVMQPPGSDRRSCTVYGGALRAALASQGTPQGSQMRYEDARLAPSRVSQPQVLIGLEGARCMERVALPARDSRRRAVVADGDQGAERSAER